MRNLFRCTLCAVFLATAAAASAQVSLGSLAPATPTTTALTTTPAAALPAGTQFLFDLEKKFAAATLAGGGRVFASWFADDGVEIQNKKAPVVGHAAIAGMAQWDPKDYRLQWSPQGGQMLPGGTSGYTWGHYEARSTDAAGKPVVTTGRYISFWKQQPDGAWKVALDASNEEPPEDCGCSIPQPGTLSTVPNP
jgi:ketosteroid isomerase-like protein